MPDIAELPPVHAAAHRGDFEALGHLIKATLILLDAPLEQDYDEASPSSVAAIFGDQ